jgi:hypothetical protein
VPDDRDEDDYQLRNILITHDRPSWRFVVVYSLYMEER